MYAIDVTITVDHKNEEKAKELIDYIEVEFSQTGKALLSTTFSFTQTRFLLRRKKRRRENRLPGDL